MQDSDPAPQKRGSLLQFPLRLLLLVVLLVSVFLAGRYGLRGPSSPNSLAGNWTAELPAGFERPVTLSHQGDGKFIFSSGASVFNGVYQWKDGQLVVVEPSDKRMKGLTWKWDSDKQRMLLVAEPTGTPTGSSYLGTTLVRAEDETKP